MLAKQLKKVIEIDEQINSIHQELSDLYAERAKITEDEETAAAESQAEKPEELTQDRWTQMQYQRLSSAWQTYDIAVPSKKSLAEKLNKAYDLIMELSAKAPDLDGKLTVVLVPPHKQLPFPVPSAIREKTDETRENDFVNPELEMPRKTKGWKVLVAYNAPEGMYLGNAESIVEYDLHKFAGHAMNDLGLREYTALTLQEKNIDTSSWTMLLKDQQPSADSVTIASQHDGRFRFDLTESNSIFSDDRFRPAVEVAA